MENEIWRDVPGKEGLYQVSNKNGWKSLNNQHKKEPTGFISHGYRVVSVNGVNYRYHILVAKAFPEICGEWFEGAQVHHKNFNKLDNRPENLIVLTPSEHSKLHYQFQPETFTKASKKRSKSISKALKGRRAYDKHIPINQLFLNGEFVKKWECMADAAKELGYSAGNICMCCKGQIKTAYGFLWQYAVNT